jgi:NADP-dependent aldehyde dehydrogenase
MPTMEPVLIAGEWRDAQCVEGAGESFRTVSPATGGLLAPKYPVSCWSDVEEALDAGAAAGRDLRAVAPAAIAAALEGCAGRLEARAAEVAAVAAAETGLEERPRLLDDEIPGTIARLQRAAQAARDRSWKRPTLDRATATRSMRVGLPGPVAIFGGIAAPVAGNGVLGGDFAGAIAAGNAVIAKGHSAHPGTTKLLAEIAHEAVTAAGLPGATVQVFYRCGAADVLRLAGDRRLGALSFTGSRRAGLELEAAARRAGNRAYVETGGSCPVVILPGALQEDGEGVVGRLIDAVLASAGQAPAKPGLVLLVASAATEETIERVAAAFDETPPGALLSDRVATDLHEAIEVLVAAGADVAAGGERLAGTGGFRHQNTLLRVDGEAFLAAAGALQRPAFGNAALCVVAADIDELLAVLDALGEAPVGGVLAARSGSEDALAGQVTAALERRVRRLAVDALPAGAAAAAVIDLAESLDRYSRRVRYEGARAVRLPPELRDVSPVAGLWRLVDGRWLRTPG